jgi:hypothetical protein
MLFSDGRTRLFLQLQNTSADGVVCLFFLPYYLLSQHPISSQQLLAAASIH